jgi:hypothetical protein
LRSFWDEITAHTSLWPSALGGPLAVWQQKASALTALMFGQPGFFTPRTLQDWLSPGKPVSYYDTSALKGTLERLVDFDRINNAKDMRLSVGAVNVRTGQLAYFDSATITIRPALVLGDQSAKRVADQSGAARHRRLAGAARRRRGGAQTEHQRAVDRRYRKDRAGKDR